MKTLLRRGVPFFVVLCVGALAADLALRLSLRRLDRWRFVFEAAAIVAGILAVYCYAMFQAIIRKEAQA